MPRPHSHWGSPRQMSGSWGSRLDLSLSGQLRGAGLRSSQGPELRELDYAWGHPVPFSSNRAPGRGFVTPGQLHCTAVPGQFCQTQGTSWGWARSGAPRETGEMPTIKQLQLGTFLIISEEKNGQADGVRQNEKWTQAAGLGRQAACAGLRAQAGSQAGPAGSGQGL